MISADALHSVFGALLASADATNAKLANPLHSLEPVQDALEGLREGDAESVYMRLLYPLDCAVDGLLGAELGTDEARFLVKHYSFVENHIERLIRKFEGNACCADKSRTIVGRLLRLLNNGEAIVFDYTQKYTYHLPRCIFTTQDDIVMFFKGLHHLYYGNPDHYLQALSVLMPKATAAAETRAAEQAQTAAQAAAANNESN